MRSSSSVGRLGKRGKEGAKGVGVGCKTEEDKP